MSTNNGYQFSGTEASKKNLSYIFICLDIDIQKGHLEFRFDNVKIY